MTPRRVVIKFLEHVPLEEVELAAESWFGGLVLEACRGDPRTVYARPDPENWALFREHLSVMTEDGLITFDEQI
jgi:hypothetical protein